MFSGKKVNSDLFLFLFLILRLVLEPNDHVNNRWHQVPESRDVFLGPTSAYTQISFHSPYSTGHYPHPKSLDYNDIDEARILFSRLNFYNSLRNGGENLIALVADSSNNDGNDQFHENINSNNSGNGFRAHSLQTSTSHPVINGGSSDERDSRSYLDSLGLSPEDMDLIEILWKQDIDLGVSRDAYDTRPCLEVEKLKESEFQKEKDLFSQPDVEEYEEPSEVPDPLMGLNYTIDSETGEHILEEFSAYCQINVENNPLLKNDTKYIENEILNENETLGALTEDSYLPFDDHDEFCNFTELFSPDQLSHLLTDDISTDSDYLSQIEDLEKELEQFDNLNETNAGRLTTGEMYPTMDDCWPDATAMMPLLPLGSTHQAAISPLSPHPMHGFPAITDNNNLPLPVAPPTRTNESFIGMLQNVSIEVPAADDEYHQTNLSSAIGPSSVGCAVAESMATLTNDTDPIPTNSVINTAYGSDFSELLYSNHTVSVPHNELLISDLLLEEDLNLVSLPSHCNDERRAEDQMDTSSDSASLASGRLPSVSDYQDWIDSCSEASSHHGERDDQAMCSPMTSNSQLLFQQQHFKSSHHGLQQKRVKNSGSRNDTERDFDDGSYERINCNDQHFLTLKTFYSDISENCEAAVNGKINFNKKFDYSISKTPAVGESNFLHHNHSYHLPFHGDDSHYKPITKDKSKCSSEDDTSNKDEKRAKELKLPISINDIINLAIEEYNERLTKYELSEAQLTLIRDIRRRGKNKVAAQNCRKRKMDQISSLQQDLGFLQREKVQLLSKQNHLLQEKHHFEDKYAELYDLVLQSSNCKPPNPPASLSLHRSRRMGVPTNSELLSEDDTDPNRGARTKRKFKK